MAKKKTEVRSQESEEKQPQINADEPKVIVETAELRTIGPSVKYTPCYILAADEPGAMEKLIVLAREFPLDDGIADAIQEFRQWRP